jgi:hypothetical protein
MDIEVKAIESLVIKDEEIEALTWHIDFKNIKQKSLEGIRKEKKKMKKSMKKSLIIAAAVLAIGGTVFATEYLDNFKMFYGEKAAVTSKDKIVINREQTISGIKMTVQEGVIGDKSAIIMVAFQKEDGTAFSEDTRVKTLEFLGEKQQSFGYMVGQQVTPDGLRLIGNFEIATMESLNGQQVVIRADEIYEESTQESIVKGPWQTTFKVDAAHGVHKKAINLQIKQEKEELKLNQISVSALGVELEGERLDEYKDKLPDYTPVVEVTTTDNKTITLRVSSTNETDEGFKWLYNMDTNNNIIFIDEQEVDSIRIDGEIINIR